MREIPAALAAHLAGSATTLADAWIVRRTDGAVFGFTDHDRPISVDGTICTPVSGFDPTTARRNVGFAPGDEEISGALTSELITDADLAAGLWDGASIAVYLVNWQASEEALLVRTGRLGEVTASDGAFKAELRGPAARLDQPTGRLYSRFCDAMLGDGRCAVSLAGWRWSATVAFSSTARVLVVDGVEDRPAGLFSGGRLTFESGALAATVAAVDEHLADDFGVRLVLRHDLDAVPAAGDGLTLEAGCDKDYATCRDRFGNHENFRGFPQMPGRDFVFSYATDDDDGVLY